MIEFVMPVPITPSPRQSSWAVGAINAPVLNSKEDYITKGVMWERVGKSEAVFVCPSDTSMTKDSKGNKQRRKRSCSMNILLVAGPAGRFGVTKSEGVSQTERVRESVERFVLPICGGTASMPATTRDMNGWPDKPQMHRFWQITPACTTTMPPCFPRRRSLRKETLARRAHQKSTGRSQWQHPQPGDQDTEQPRHPVDAATHYPPGISAERYVGPSFAYTAKLADILIGGFGNLRKNKLILRQENSVFDLWCICRKFIFS